MARTSNKTAPGTTRVVFARMIDGKYWVASCEGWPERVPCRTRAHAERVTDEMRKLLRGKPYVSLRTYEKNASRVRTIGGLANRIAEWMA